MMPKLGNPIRFGGDGVKQGWKYVLEAVEGRFLGLRKAERMRKEWKEWRTTNRTGFNGN